MLGRELAREKARAAFEGICRLYVSMTRAKLALYAIVEEKVSKSAKKTAGAESQSCNEAGLLMRRLGSAGPMPYDAGTFESECLWETGERSWYTSRAKQVPAARHASIAADGPDLGTLLRKVNEGVQRRAPSGEEAFLLTGKEFTSPVREARRLHGVLVHDLLAAVAWLDGVTDISTLWRDRGLAEDDPAATQVLALLAEPSIRPWFTRGGASRGVWIERRFDLVSGKDWISGILDRVVLEYDAQGRVAAATILDYKTDEVPGEEAMRQRAEGYRPQMKLYRESVARLTGLRPAEVKVILIFTASRRLWPLNFR